MNTFRASKGAWWRSDFNSSLGNLRPRPDAQTMCVLNALPWSREEFLAQVAEGRHFALRQLSLHHSNELGVELGHPGTVEKASKKLSEDVFERTTIVQRIAGALDVPIFKATLENIEPALCQFDITIVLAHSTGNKIVENTIIWNDLTALRSAIEASNLRAELKQSLLSQSDFNKKRVANILHRHLEDIAECATTRTETTRKDMVDLRRLDWLTPQGYDEIPTPVLATKDFAYGLMRETLDIIAKGFLYPGNKVDLCSGLASYDEIASAFPESWDGAVDLEICEGAYVANRMRTTIQGGQIYAEKMQIAPVRALHILKALLIEVRFKGGAFSFVRPKIDSAVRY